MCLPFCWAPGNSLQRHCFCRGQTAGLNNKRGIKHPAWEKWSTGQTLVQRSCCRHESLMRGVSRLTWKHLHTNKPRRRSNPHLSQLRLEALLASNLHLWSNALLDLPRPIATFKSNIFLSLLPSVKAVFKHSMTFWMYHLPRKPPLFCRRRVWGLVSSNWCRDLVGASSSRQDKPLPFSKCNTTTEVMTVYTSYRHVWVQSALL